MQLVYFMIKKPCEGGWWLDQNLKAALTDEFLAESQAPKLELQHHEQNKSFQNRFKGDVEKMVTKFEEMGNPFLEDSYTLINKADIVPCLIKHCATLGNDPQVDA